MKKSGSGKRVKQVAGLQEKNSQIGFSKFFVEYEIGEL